MIQVYLTNIRHFCTTVAVLFFIPSLYYTLAVIDNIVNFGVPEYYEEAPFCYVMAVACLSVFINNVFMAIVMHFLEKDR